MTHTEPSLAVDKMAVLLNGTIVEKYLVLMIRGGKKTPSREC